MCQCVACFMLSYHILALVFGMRSDLGLVLKPLNHNFEFMDSLAVNDLWIVKENERLSST